MWFGISDALIGVKTLPREEGEYLKTGLSEHSTGISMLDQEYSWTSHYLLVVVPKYYVV